MVKFICGMISSRPELLDLAAARLAELFGPADVVSETMPFDLTHYYDQQTGSPLWRRFLAFETLRCPGELAEAKVRTNDLESGLAEQFPDGPSRPVNIDPGYLTEAKLVLASMKDFSHRVYLGSGVYGEATLMYHSGGWESFPWTFPDYASGRYDAFLTAARETLRNTKENKR